MNEAEYLERRRQLYSRRYKITVMLLQKYTLMRQVSDDVTGVEPDTEAAWLILDELTAADPPIKPAGLAKFLKTKTRVYQLTCYVERQLAAVRRCCSTNSFDTLVDVYVLGLSCKSAADRENLTLRGLHSRREAGVRMLARLLFVDVYDYMLDKSAGL